MTKTALGWLLQTPGALEALANPSCGWLYTCNAERFSAIPSSPIAYWASKSMFSAFECMPPLKDVAFAGKGVVTGDDNRFLKMWHEVGRDSFSEFAPFNETKWKPCNKGGQFRRWYGNNDYVINWGKDGSELKNHCWPDGRQRSSLRNSGYMFVSAITWTYISTGKPCFRYYPDGFAFVGVGPGVFPKNRRCLLKMLAFLNSTVFEVLTSLAGGSTISLESGEVERVPFCQVGDEEGKIEAMVDENVRFAKDDWNAFETSWNFAKHPLI